MANEIQVAHTTTGQTLYAVIRNSTGLVWQVTSSTFVAYATANLSTYVIALAEQGVASRLYSGNFPAVPAGIYSVVAYQQATGSPAESDLTVAEGNTQWDGTAVLPLSNLPGTILDNTNGVENGYTLRQGLRLILAALAGKISGAGTTTITIRDVNDTKNRIVAIVDGKGNRTTVTLDDT